MKWSDSGESQDIEDRRDETGGGGGFQFGGLHIGIGGAIILLILSFVFKTNLFTLLSGGGAASGPAEVRQPNPARRPNRLDKNTFQTGKENPAEGSGGGRCRRGSLGAS